MSIRPYTSEYTAVYSKWVGRYTAVYSRYTAVYWEYMAVYRGYTAVYTRYTAVFQDHGTGWVRGMHATLANEMFQVQTPLPSNMQKRVYTMQKQNEQKAQQCFQNITCR